MNFCWYCVFGILMSTFCQSILAVDVSNHDLEQDVEFEATDTNQDGRVDRQEFQRGKDHDNDEVFGCLDTDMNGFVTKEERDLLKTRFYRSRLSQLSATELLKWIAHDQCVPTQLDEYLPALRAANINGLAMWDYGVRSPARLRDELHIHSPAARRTLVHAICREIEGLGCLGPPTAPTRVNLDEPAAAAGAASARGRPALAGSADADAIISMEEFVGGHAELAAHAFGGAYREAIACMDPDENGQARLSLSLSLSLSLTRL